MNRIQAFRFVALSALTASCSREPNADRATATVATASATTALAAGAVVSSARPPSPHTAPSAASSIVPPTVSYAAYTNPRFFFGVEYPTFLTREPPPANGDGQIFKKGEHVTLTVSGIANALHETLDAQFGDASKSAGVTYKKKQSDGYVVSGTEGGKIFYERVLYSKDVIKTLRLEYDAALKSAMDPIVTRVASSFHTTGGVGP